VTARAVTIGIDVVQISRFEQALRRRPRLAQRCFSPAEQAYCSGQRRPGRHFAARFAAKEAVAKALQAPVRWREIEVVREGGPPSIILSGKTLARAAGRIISITMSHDGDVAVAAAIAEVVEP
jgi:holo-[acyl-carrier protein] synthase